MCAQRVSPHKDLGEWHKCHNLKPLLKLVLCPPIHNESGEKVCGSSVECGVGPVGLWVVRSDWITPFFFDGRKEGREGRRGGNETLAPSLPRDGDDDEVFKA